MFDDPADRFDVYRDASAGYQWVRVTRRGTGTADAPAEDPWLLLVTEPAPFFVSFSLLDADVRLDAVTMTSKSDYVPSACDAYAEDSESDGEDSPPDSTQPDPPPGNPGEDPPAEEPPDDPPPADDDAQTSDDRERPADLDEPSDQPLPASGTQPTAAANEDPTLTSVGCRAGRHPPPILPAGVLLGLLVQQRLRARRCRAPSRPRRGDLGGAPTLRC